MTQICDRTKAFSGLSPVLVSIAAYHRLNYDCRLEGGAAGSFNRAVLSENRDPMLLLLLSLTVTTKCYESAS